MICSFAPNEKRNPFFFFFTTVTARGYMPLYCGPPPPSGGTQVMTW